MEVGGRREEREEEEERKRKRWGVEGEEEKGEEEDEVNCKPSETLSDFLSLERRPLLEVSAHPPCPR